MKRKRRKGMKAAEDSTLQIGALRDIELELILGNLDVADQAVCQRVSKRWKKVLELKLLPVSLDEYFPQIAKYHDRKKLSTHFLRLNHIM